MILPNTYGEIEVQNRICLSKLRREEIPMGRPLLRLRRLEHLCRRKGGPTAFLAQLDAGRPRAFRSFHS